MYLSNRDIEWAIRCGKLIVEPRPEANSPPKGYDDTAIDLHLGPIVNARVWDLTSLAASDAARGTARAGQAPKSAWASSTIGRWPLTTSSQCPGEKTLRKTI